MNLPKAIEIKEIYYNGGEIPSHSDYREADMLSIEALKSIVNYRQHPFYSSLRELPGETEK